MPKFPEYAAAIAPIIDAAHINLHAAARRATIELADTSGITPGPLIDLRYTLPQRPLTRHDLATIYRYGAPSGIQDHLDEGTLTENDGELRLTRKGLEFVDALYTLHATAAARIWTNDVPWLAETIGKLLATADRVPGGALELMAPPYEPEWATPGLLLFNRLAALRYHRADAHAAAWQAQGLSAAEIVVLRDGPLHARIEADTNRRAATPYRILSEHERQTLHDGLLKLV
ncbi:hypothetical protein ACFOY2_37525 [Nonomuraea purpurea]|uniref:Transcriptional regulator n=1 Tax=Nonomuraea purpurea TaxID=1849276 RepID=A0ABV8GJA7_9ACTN